MLKGRFSCISDAARAVAEQCAQELPDGLSLVDAVICNHYPRARFIGVQYSSVDFFTNEGKNITTWIPDMNCILWHNKERSPNGRPYGPRVDDAYSNEDIGDFIHPELCEQSDDCRETE